MSDRPKMVCLCGSTRFKDAFARQNARLTLEGKIVLTVGIFARADGIELSAEQKRGLDELHLRKIELADEIFVVNVGGYYGESTAHEIEYAESIGKPVGFLARPMAHVRRG